MLELEHEHFDEASTEMIAVPVDALDLDGMLTGAEMRDRKKIRVTVDQVGGVDAAGYSCGNSTQEEHCQLCEDEEAKKADKNTVKEVMVVYKRRKTIELGNRNVLFLREVLEDRLVGKR